MTQETRGGKRAGAGRRPSKTPTRSKRFTARVLLTDKLTLDLYPSGDLAALIAAGLRLGKGNLPEFTEAERVLLAEVLRGADVLALRHLEDEVADIETDDGGDLPERETLIAKLRPLGDWERIVLKLGGV